MTPKSDLTLLRYYDLRKSGALKMFLKTVLNPYQNGHPTRSVFYRPTPSQTYAIDAEQLHKNPGLLNAIAPHRSVLIRSLDIAAWVIALAGVVASYVFVWWLCVPALAAAVAMYLANKKLAGTIARKAAASSNEHFLYLHSQKALWLVTEQSATHIREAA